MIDSMLGKSPFFSLERHNPRVSGNYVLSVRGGGLFIDAIESAPELSDGALSGFAVDAEEGWGNALARYYANLRDKTLFHKVKYPEAGFAPTLSEQHDYIYEWGLERGKFFAPLYMREKAPDAFVVFAEKNGVYEDAACWDLTERTDAGVFLRSLAGMVGYAPWCIRADFSEGFLYKGIDLNTGGIAEYAEGGIAERLANETTIAEFESRITGGWARGGLALHTAPALSFEMPEGSMPEGFFKYKGAYGTLSPNPEGAYALMPSGLAYIGAKSASYENIFDTFSILKGGEMPPMCAVVFESMPAEGDFIKLAFAGITELEFKFPALSTIGGAVAHAVSEINRLSAYTQDISVSAYSEGGILFIKSASSARIYENIEATASGEFCAISPFRGVYAETDYLIGGVPSKLPEYAYAGDAKIKPVGVYMYGRYSAMRFEAAPPASVLRLCETAYAPRYDFVASPHADYDMSRDESIYGGVCDIDGAGLLNWARGNGGATPELAEYCAGVPTKPLIISGGIDPVTLESTESIANEYDRVDNSIDALSWQSRINAHVLKFAYSGGFSACFANYKLDIGLAMRAENYAPSLTYSGRGIRQLTHHWFAIGAPAPGHLTDARAVLGYSQAGVLTEAHFLSEGADPFIALKTPEGGAWADIKGGECFFMGIPYRLPASFEGWRFSAVLIPMERYAQPASAGHLSLAANVAHKTLALLIKFQFSAPALSGIAGGFYLDRSFFYYTGKNYETSAGAGARSLAPCSLARPVPYVFGGRASWKVYAGDRARFRLPFTDVIELPQGGGSTFTIYGGAGDTPAITASAVGISAVYADYFVCSDILLELAESADSNGQWPQYFDRQAVRQIGGRTAPCLSLNTDYFAGFDAIAPDPAIPYAALACAGGRIYAHGIDLGFAQPFAAAAFDRHTFALLSARFEEAAFPAFFREYSSRAYIVMYSEAALSYESAAELSMIGYIHEAGGSFIGTGSRAVSQGALCAAIPDGNGGIDDAAPFWQYAGGVLSHIETGAPIGANNFVGYYAGHPYYMPAAFGTDAPPAPIPVMGGTTFDKDPIWNAVGMMLQSDMSYDENGGGVRLTPKFAKISAASARIDLESYPLRCAFSGGAETYERAYMLKPHYTYALGRIAASGGVLKPLAAPYAFPIGRHSGAYEPMFRVVDEGKTYARYRKSLSGAASGGWVACYDRDYSKTPLENGFFDAPYLQNGAWGFYACPAEARGFVSLALHIPQFYEAVFYSASGDLRDILSGLAHLAFGRGAMPAEGAEAARMASGIADGGECEAARLFSALSLIPRYKIASVRNGAGNKCDYILYGFSFEAKTALMPITIKFERI